MSFTISDDQTVPSTFCFLKNSTVLYLLYISKNILRHDYSYLQKLALVAVKSTADIRWCLRT